MIDADDLERELRQYYLTVAQAKLEALSAALAEARQRPSEASSIEQLRFVVHKIAGSAGSYGFEALGSSAKAVEKEIRAARGPLPAHVLLAAERFLVCMAAEFAAAREQERARVCGEAAAGEGG